MTSMMIKTNDSYNPLDLVELVVMNRDWVFDRPADGEIIAEVTGVWCNYRMWCNWQEDSGGFTLSCTLDAKLTKPMLPKVYALLALVNEKLWLGHFDICEQTSVTFRHSMLLRDGAGTTEEHLQELFDLAISECERFYPAFQSVVWGGKSPAEALEIALFETVAEC